MSKTTFTWLRAKGKVNKSLYFQGQGNVKEFFNLEGEIANLEAEKNGHGEIIFSRFE